MSGSRQPGSTCAYVNPVAVADGTTCLAPSPAPGPVGGLPLTAGSRSSRSITSMSHKEKMAMAIRRAYDAGLISREIMRQLPGVEELAIGIVVVGGVLVGLGVAAGAVASTGVGAVLEAIAAAIVLALAAIGIISSAGQVIAGIDVLITFYRSTERASSYVDLDQAGREFATGLAEVGVGTILMILSVIGARQGLKMAKGAASAPPASESPSEPFAKPRIREEPPPPRKPEPRRATPNRDVVDADAAGVPIGARRGVAKPGLPAKALSKEGWPDLPADQAPNFNSAEAVALKPGTKIYRVIDDSSNPAGGYWTEKLPASRAEWRSDLAVRSDFNANGKYVEYTVPDGPGLNVWRGETAAQPLPGSNFYYPGGGQQLWMPPNTVTPGVPKPTGW